MSAVILRRVIGFIRPLLLAAPAICLLSAAMPAHARSTSWPQFRFWWGDHYFRHKPQHTKHTKSDLAKEPQTQEDSKGPLQIIISIADQRISVYENGALIARSSVSTGVERHPTPLGVFSVIGKHKWHRSNIYSAAPMPYMQRITWSGIALHAGDLPGYPASHGCIRLTNDFATRLWRLTKRGTRVIIVREDVQPAEITNPHLFVPKPKVASASTEAGTATLASNDNVTGAITSSLISNKDEGAKTSDAASAGVRTQKAVPITVFVSRQLSKLFVRRGFTPLFEVPIKIRDMTEPMGTHVFSAMKFQDEGAALRWTVVSVPEKSPPNQGNSPGLQKGSSIPDKANAALERIEIGQDVVDRISDLITPGSSLIISDHGISHETGRDTDFIVLTH